MEGKEIQLRPYQEEALASIPETGAFVICLATGLGKTICMSRIQRRGRMLILSHRDELVHQPEKYFDCTFGVEQGDETSHGEEVVSASVQSLVRRLHKFRPDDFDVLVTDECFIGSTRISMPNEQTKAIADIQEGEYVLGLNPESRQLEPFKVTHKFIRSMPKDMLIINGKVMCTVNHPFLRWQDERYISAIKFKVKDELCKQLGYSIIPEPVTSILWFKGVENAHVYNLEVEQVNNYVAEGYVVHNCHHSTAPTYRKIYEYFKPRLHLGFTATPNRNDGVGLKAIYEDIIYERNLKWGIENGYLSNIHCLRVDIGVDLRQVAQRLGDYASDSLERAMNIESANDAIAEAYKLYAKPPVLIFCASVAHAEALAEKIPGAVAVRGGEDRSETVQAFSEGKIPCLTNCMVFTEGTDLPNVQTVIMARPTKNISLYTQICGRGLRLYPGKEYLTLIDCVGACDEADLCTAPSLLGLDIENVPPSQRKNLTGDLFDIPEILTELEDTPEAWIRNVERVDLWARRNSYDMHGVNYFRMPDGSLVLSALKMKIPAEDSLGRIMWNGRPEPAQKVFDEVYGALVRNYSDKRALWDLNLTRHWGASPATDKQKTLIRKYLPGCEVESLTKFDAAQILTRCMANGPAYEPPTEKQVYVLRRNGYEVEGLSKYDAMKIIRRLKGE